jgi:hypothetical protein
MEAIKKRFSEIRAFVEERPDAKSGCLMDTNILFSASYDLDHFNADAAELVNVLAELEIPIYTTFSVRGEFLELHRRVTIPECLIDLLEDIDRSELDGRLLAKLVSLRTSYRKSVDAGRPYKLNDQQIKEFRTALALYEKDGLDGWEAFCQNYLHSKIEKVWDVTVEQLGLNFIDMRESAPDSDVVKAHSWHRTTDLIGKFGIGSIDATILDVFFNSNFLFLLTSDRDMAYCVERSKTSGRFVFVPDGLM